MTAARLALLMFVATPVAAHAAADGGVRSPFADGAGNRALAMGGAYAALADDPGAGGWNPAGLARLQRPALQVSRASLYGLDTTEEFAAFAWPSWRWGAAGLAVRRLGTDGIERRDDRNLLLGEFSATEMELAASWGRALGDAWCVGAGVKLARQDIDARAGTGVGVDLGAMVRPGVAFGGDVPVLARTTLGVSVRNLVSPTIRLDESEVSDPTEFRIGAAWEHPLGGGRSVRVATDLVAAQRTDVAPRAGAEVVPHPMVALRGGWNGESVTAGAGVRWRTNSFDYAFEDNPIEVVHRFGVTLAFGPSVGERRAADRLAEEAAIRERLDRLFVEREEERLAELLDRGRTLLAEGRSDEAADAAAGARALRPDDARAVRLEAECLAAQAAAREGRGELADAMILYARAVALAPDDAGLVAAATRCREASDLREERDARVRALHGEALDAFAAGDYRRSRDRLHTLLEVSPDDADGRTLLVRAEAAIALRVGDLVQQARDASAEGRYDDAEARLDAARSLDPGAAAVATAAERLRRAVRDAEARARATRDGERDAPSPAPAPPAVSRKKQREIADLYLRGVEAAEAGQAEDAIRYWELVWSADPAYEQVAAFLKREYLLRGLDAFSRGRLDDAIDLWERARTVDPTDERTLGYLARAREQSDRSRQILGGSR